MSIKCYVHRTEAEFRAFWNKHHDEWEATGAEIKRLRSELQMSKARLAKMCGICPRTLTKLESGLYITRFKPISRSCLNVLNAVNLLSYRDALDFLGRAKSDKKNKK
jgi:DNA-binding XRE family transcriptional regulator